MAKCTARVETYSRIVGYYRPVQQWNKAKQEEFKQRKLFNLKKFDKATEFASGSPQADDGEGNDGRSK